MGWANGRQTAALRERVVEEWGTTCWLCGGPIDTSLTGSAPGRLSLDHVVPRSRGGGDELANLRPAHFSCNSSRGAGRRRRKPKGPVGVGGPVVAAAAVADWLANAD